MWKNLKKKKKKRKKKKKKTRYVRRRVFTPCDATSRQTTSLLREKSSAGTGRKREEEEKRNKKGNPCRCVSSTNHQFHIKPKTVLNTRPISIQAFLKPFGAFGALKGLIVPSSALHQPLHLCSLLFGKYHGQPLLFVLFRSLYQERGSFRSGGNRATLISAAFLALLSSGA